MRRNEWRDWIDMSLDPEMDELLALENYIPVSMLGKQKRLEVMRVEKNRLLRQMRVGNAVSGSETEAKRSHRKAISLYLAAHMSFGREQQRALTRERLTVLSMMISGP